MIKDDVKSGVSVPETFKPTRTKTSTTSSKNVMVDAAEEFGQTMEAVIGYRPKKTIVPGQLCSFSTSAQSSDTQGWCVLFLNGKAGVYGDQRTGLSSVWLAQLPSLATLTQRQQYADELHSARAEAANMQAVQQALEIAKHLETWQLACPIKAGDPVAKYLENQGLRLDNWPKSLRYHSNLDYWEEDQFTGYHPAMLAEVTDVDGCIVGLHQTYLTLDGRKADVPVVKKLTGRSTQLLTGCSVKLYPPALIKGVKSIGVAESIETALACFMASDVPTVAAISAEGLARYQWPWEVRNLIIYADNDLSKIGQGAAKTLAQRAKNVGLANQVLTPSQPGTSWADEWALWLRSNKWLRSNCSWNQ